MITKIKKKLYDIYYGYRYYKLKRRILDYYKSHSQELTDEKREALHYIKKHGMEVFPYPYIQKYKKKNISVLYDEECGLKYVMHEGKRLYFYRGCDDSVILETYLLLQKEQDPQSPHRYLTTTFNVDENDVVLDIGCAEGNFALSVVEKAKKVILFELEEKWVEALEHTFAPWRSKVEIIKKYVSDVDSDKSITIDSLPINDEDKSFLIKVDVEGAELSVLNGAKKLLNSNRCMKIVLCTYHKQEDEQLLTAKMKEYNYEVEASNGYLFFIYCDTLDPPGTLDPPFFRRGLIYCTNTKLREKM